MISGDVLVQVERTAALAEAAVAATLSPLDQRWLPAAFSVAGGQVVLLGPGMYVNRGMALGLGIETTTEDLQALEAASQRAGVPAEVEVTPLAEPSLLKRTAARGYRPVGFRSTLLRHLPEFPELAGIVTIEEVSDGCQLDHWQATAAEGFGYTTDDDRRTSDLYTAAISRLEQRHLYVAHSADRPVAVASLTILDRVAILGGMTTHPLSRGLGIQTETHPLQAGGGIHGWMRSGEVDRSTRKRLGTEPPPERLLNRLHHSDHAPPSPLSRRGRGPTRDDPRAQPLSTLKDSGWFREVRQRRQGLTMPAAGGAGDADTSKLAGTAPATAERYRARRRCRSRALLRGWIGGGASAR